MKFKGIRLLIFILFHSIYLPAQNNKTRIPDSLIFTGTHVSFSELYGKALAITNRTNTGIHSLGSPLHPHYNFGIALAFWKKSNPIYISFGIKVDLWFFAYALDIKKTASNNLFFDMKEWDSDYFTSSDFYYLETGYRYNLGKRFYAIPFCGAGIEYIHAMESTFTESEVDSAQNRRVLLYSENSNEEIKRLEVRVHTGISFAYLLPYGHLVSLKFTGSWSTGMIAKGYYMLVPGTTEESTGTYDLKGNYFGLDLSYTFTGIRKKRKRMI
ncbi:MAG: hypothetical protein ABIQ40_04655 [Bacteroidia bacterium]